jgi:hypothetical protein
MNKKRFIDALTELAEASTPSALIAAMEGLLTKGDFDDLEWQDAQEVLRQYKAVVEMPRNTVDA